MFIFPWIVLILLLLMLAELLIILPVALRGLVVERHAKLAHPSTRIVATLTLLEMLIVLIWGIYERTH